MSTLRWGRRLDPASIKRVSDDPAHARQQQSMVAGPIGGQPVSAGGGLPEQVNDWTERYLQSVQGRRVVSSP